MAHGVTPSIAFIAGRFLLRVVILISIFAAPASANEVMTDRCQGDVSFPPTYDLAPTVTGSMTVTRGGSGGGRWSPAIRQQIDRDGHIRWWCHSTTGNWADPGTWTVDDAGGTYTCNDNGDCTLAGNASAHPVDIQGWTAERSRCENHSNTFRARLGTDRLLEIECLGNTGSVSQRLIGAPQNISQLGFGNSSPPPIVIRPVQHAPLDAWIGEFVYPRGSHATDNTFVLSVSSARVLDNRTVPHSAGDAYGVMINEKTRTPFSLDQSVTLTSISQRGQIPFDKDFVAPHVDVTTPGRASEHMLHSVPMTPSHSPVAISNSNIAPQAMQNSTSIITQGTSVQHGAHSNNGTERYSVAVASNTLEWADTMIVSPDVSLMLYVAGSKDGPITGYAIRYIRRSGNTTISDVMMMPPVEQPH